MPHTRTSTPAQPLAGAGQRQGRRPVCCGRGSEPRNPKGAIGLTFPRLRRCAPKESKHYGAAVLASADKTLRAKRSTLLWLGAAGPIGSMDCDRFASDHCLAPPYLRPAGKILAGR